MLSFVRLVDDDTLGDSPAAIVHGKCGKVLVNPQMWDQIPRDEQNFIIDHELAHCRHGTRSEMEADRIGFLSYLKNGGDPETPIRALSQNLNLAEPAIQQRVMAMKHRRINYLNGQPISYANGGSGSGTMDVNSSDLTDYYNQQMNAQVAQAGNDTDKWDLNDWAQLATTLLPLAAGIGGIFSGNGQGVGSAQLQEDDGGNSFLLIGVVAIAFLLLVLLITRKGA